MQRDGASVLSDAELLAMLLRSGTQGHDVLTLANELVSEAGSLADLTRWTRRDFEKRKGIGRVKALQLLAVMEVSKRVLSQAPLSLGKRIRGTEREQNGPRSDR